MSKLSSVKVEEQIWLWIDQVIIDQGFCPFAKTPRLQNKIKLVVSYEQENEKILNCLVNEFHFLDTVHDIETTLFVLAEGYTDFIDYLDLIELAEQLIASLDYSSVYQVASFHPQYEFADEPGQDTSHYTNRSPFPIIHILREDSISVALENFPLPENIPERNKQHARKLGETFFARYLQNK